MPDEQLEDRRINYERRADQERLEVFYEVQFCEQWELPISIAVFLSVEDACDYADLCNGGKKLQTDFYRVVERDFGKDPRTERTIL